MNRPLRILSISTLFPSAERPRFGLFVERGFTALARHTDVEPTVIVPVATAPWPLRLLAASPDSLCRYSEGREAGFAVHYARFPYLPRIGSRWNPAQIAHAIAPLVRRLHAETPFDAVDAQFFYPDGPAAARIAAELDLPLSIKARGSDIHYWGAKASTRRLILRAAEQANGLLAVSEAMKSDMIALGMDAGKIRVKYTGLDHATFHPRPRGEAREALSRHPALAVPASGPLFVSTGNLIPLKGQDLVIRALAQFPDAQLLLAGSGPEAARLRQLAERLGVSRRVFMPGNIAPPDLALALAAADAMVLPSEREGLANAWIEALACGAPLVITDVGGAREVVCDETAGRLVARTPDAIAAALRELLAHPPEPAAVAARAARFSWEASASAGAAYYRRLAAGA